MRKHNIGRISFIILLLNFIFIAIYLASVNKPKTVYKVGIQSVVVDDGDQQKTSGTMDETVRQDSWGMEGEGQ